MKEHRLQPNTNTAIDLFHPYKNSEDHEVRNLMADVTIINTLSRNDLTPDDRLKKAYNKKIKTYSKFKTTHRAALFPLPISVLGGRHPIVDKYFKILTNIASTHKAYFSNIDTNFSQIWKQRLAFQIARSVHDSIIQNVNKHMNQTSNTDPLSDVPMTFTPFTIQSDEESSIISRPLSLNNSCVPKSLLPSPSISQTGLRSSLRSSTGKFQLRPMKSDHSSWKDGDRHKTKLISPT